MIDREFHRLLARIFKEHEKAVFNRLQKDHISSGQPRVLHSLLECDGQSQKELAEANRLEAATVGKTLAVMEKAGFIQRVKDPQDKRSILVFITPEGKKAYDKAEKAFADIESLCFEGFDPEKIDLCLSFLRAIETNLSLLMGGRCGCGPSLEASVRKMRNGKKESHATSIRRKGSSEQGRDR